MVIFAKNHKKVIVLSLAIILVLVLTTIFYVASANHRSYLTMLGDANKSAQRLMTYEQNDTIAVSSIYVSRHAKGAVSNLIARPPMYSNNCDDGKDYCEPNWTPAKNFMTYDAFAKEVQSDKDREYMSYYESIRQDPLAKCSVHYYDKEAHSRPFFGEQLCVSPGTGLSIYLSFIT